jgi:hypothetical protein
MLATGRRTHPTELEKTHQLGRSIPPSQGRNPTTWRSYEVAAKSKADDQEIIGLVTTYFETELQLDALKKSVAEKEQKERDLEQQERDLQKQRETLLSEKAAAVQVEIESQRIIDESKRRVLEANRTAVSKALAKIFKNTQENILSMFGPEKLDRLQIEARKINIDSEGMDAIIVSYLKTHSLPALDLRRFNLQGKALGRLFQALPETDVRSICLARSLSQEEVSAKENIEKKLSALGRTLRIVVKS